VTCPYELADVDSDGVSCLTVDCQDDRYVAPPADASRNLNVDLVEPREFALRSRESNGSVHPADGGVDIRQTAILAQTGTE